MSFAAGKLDPAFSYQRLISVGEVPDKLVRISRYRRLFNLFRAGREVTVQDIFFHVAVEQERVL